MPRSARLLSRDEAAHVAPALTLTRGAELRRFADDVRSGLSASPKQLTPAYFYDDLGSSLFDAICHLPWYRITRTELSLLAEQGERVLAGLNDPLSLVELGCGNGQKIGKLLEILDGQRRQVSVHLVDVSASALEQSERLLRRWPRVRVTTHQARFESGLARATAGRDGGGSTLVLFLGSNIGNFNPPSANALLTGVRAALAPSDGLLLGADLVKSERDLLLAYDDPLGVTAAFNKNLLLRINRELGGDFDLATFDHRAVWNKQESRVEMHLVSRIRQQVSIPAAACVVSFAEGEAIWTESSYKYQPEEILRLATATGFVCRKQVVDVVEGFSLSRLDAVY